MQLGNPLLILGDVNSSTSRLPHYSIVDLDCEVLTQIEDEMIECF